MLSNIYSNLRNTSSCLILLAFCLVGCDFRSGPTLAEVHNTNIKKLRAAYSFYLVTHNLNGPENEEELKGYLKNNAGAKVKMERIEVLPEQVDDIFVSERDGKPFKVRYGLQGYSDHAIVFEAEGVDGKRLVAFNIPRDLDPKDYEAAWAGKLNLDSARDVFE